MFHASQTTDRLIPNDHYDYDPHYRYDYDYDHHYRYDHHYDHHAKHREKDREEPQRAMQNHAASHSNTMS